MKKLLTIGGETYLMPRTADLAKIAELFRDVARVQDRTLYGPEGDRHFDSEFYKSVKVVEDRPEKIRFELIHEDDVIGQAEWRDLEAEQVKKIAEYKATAPAESLSRS